MITVKFKEEDCAVNPDNKKDCDITLNNMVNWLYFKDSWYIIGGSNHNRDILKSLFNDCNTEEDQLFIWDNLLIVDNYIYFKDKDAKDSYPGSIDFMFYNVETKSRILVHEFQFMNAMAGKALNKY